MELVHLKNFIKDFNPDFQSLLRKNLDNYPHPKVRQILSQIIPIAMGGKRVRPYLSYLMDSPENHATHTPIYQALELIHLFALIHDDIMDECDTRRGEQTIHAFAREIYQHQDATKQSRITESIAILAGDLIFSLAENQFFQAIQNSQTPQTIQAYPYFNKLKEEVIYGQLLDLHLTSEQTATQKEVYDKTFYKTASYTVIKPMQIGCLLAGNDSLLEFCHTFGEALGVAFQIQDDYINLTQPQEITGKPQFSDVLESQKTFFTVYLQDHKDKSHWRFYQSFHAHKELTNSEQVNLFNSLQESGALEAGLKRFTDLYYQAEQVLIQHKDKLQTQSYEGLIELLNYLKNRQS
jgi:geranylgeranyl diphosphate synthase type I